MFGSNVLEIAIGLIFVYLLLSLLCSTINEQIIARFFALRAKTLEEGINNMLDDPKGVGLAQRIYANPLIQGLSQHSKSGKTRNPSYIPADIFASAFIQAYKNDPAVAKTPLPVALAALIKTVDPDLAQQQAVIEKWFDDTMERVSGWYKRKVQLVLLLLALVIALALNVDSLALITSLSNNAAERTAIVSAAQGYAATHNSNADLTTLEDNLKQYQPAIGWSSQAKDYPADAGSWVGWVLLKIVGLLATVFAVSLGAPFWFDLLNKIVSLRSSGPAPARTVSPLPASGEVSVPVVANVPVPESVPAAVSTPIPESVPVSGVENPRGVQ